MRTINKIVVHCSASRCDHRYTFQQCKKDHITHNHWNDIGYHYYIELDGTVYLGRQEHIIGAHCHNHNANSIGICYEGGLNPHGAPDDTRTPEQRASLRKLISDIRNRYPNAKIYGHRDLSPDLNKDGKITPNEYIKQCPCFNAQEEYADL